jgi:uncharacterized membrane protein YuzA (DUF378 family)
MKFVKFMVLLGAFNWGAIGLLRIDLVAFLFGDMTYVTRALYVVVMVCAIIYMINEKKDKKFLDMAQKAVK